MEPINQHEPSAENKEGEEHSLLSPQKSDEDSDNGITLSPVSTLVSGLTLAKSLEYHLGNDFDDKSTEVSASDKDYGPSEASSIQQMMVPPSLITLSPMSSEVSCLTLARSLECHLDSDFDGDEASSSNEDSSAVVSTNSPSEASSSQLSKAIPPLNNLALPEFSKKIESPCSKPLGILKTSTITNTRVANNHEPTFSDARNDNKKGEPLNVPPKKVSESNKFLDLALEGSDEEEDKEMFELLVSPMKMSQTPNKKLSSSLHSPVKPRRTVKFATHKKKKNLSNSSIRKAGEAR